MTLMTQADFAAHRGVGKSAVSNWKKAGLLVFAEDDAGRAMVHVERSDARLNARVDPTRGRPSAGLNGGTAPAIVESDAGAGEDTTAGGQRSLALVKAEQAEEALVSQRLKNASAASELVPRVDAQRLLAEGGRAIRERLMAWLRGSAEQRVAMRDVKDLLAFEDAEVSALFAELAQQAAAGVFAAPDEDQDDAPADGEEQAA
ncbi:hypothetical protein [Stakelama tenebrarum]|uniref:Uncharacterized protein n=1 Tax=Stakelama tenebrarum TaxID=2711215 RepID=A0A6G6Y4Z9_9SPHN|nr:hypothetical protein [Sphingosinithalassobacter tenebrarum]QIG79980.1 hypothetical protein G5C33_09465 [Sphingosinithalassobacter tenebrarum]